MSATGNAPVDPGALNLPPYSMDVETLDLGSEVKAVGLELLETESREPVKGKEAAAIWAAAFPALANNDGFSLDFFAHVDRVKEFCKMYDIHYREAAERCVVLRAPAETQRYSFCAVCEPEDGWVTLLSKTLWPTEIIRRLRPAVERFDVYLARPQ
jgi:hypothetical protein